MWPETGPAPQAARIPWRGGASGARSGRLAASAEEPGSAQGGQVGRAQPWRPAPPRVTQHVTGRHRSQRRPKKRPKATSRSVAPADHSPCLAPLETPTPARGQGERPPRRSPKTTWLSLGSIPSRRGSTAGLGGQQDWKLPCGPRGSRRGPREAYRDKAGISGQSPRMLTGGQKEDTWGYLVPLWSPANPPAMVSGGRRGSSGGAGTLGLPLVATLPLGQPKPYTDMRSPGCAG